MQNHNYSFVIRLWLEGTYGDKKIAIWRGSIEQVGSDYLIHFSNLDEITKFIQTQVGLDAPAPIRNRKLSLEHIQNDIRKLWKRLLR